MNKYMQALNNRNFVRECEEYFDTTEPMDLHYPDNCIRWLQSIRAHATFLKQRHNLENTTKSSEMKWCKTP